MNVSAINSYSASFGNKSGKVADNKQPKPGTAQVEIPGLTTPASDDVKKALKTQKNIGYAGIAATALAVGGSFFKNRALRFVTALPAIATTAVAGLIFFASAKKAEQLMDAMEKTEAPAADETKKAENAPADDTKTADVKKEEPAKQAESTEQDK